MKKEKWRKITFAKEYYISSYGRVYSTKTNKFLFPEIHKSQTGRVSRKVSLNGKRYFVHRLVAWGFKRLKIDDKESIVRHRDHNSLNNNANNLTVGTQSQNMKDRWQAARTDFLK